MEWLLLQRLELSIVQRILDPSTFNNQSAKPLAPEKKHDDADADADDEDEDDEPQVKVKEEKLAVIKRCRQHRQILKEGSQLLEKIDKINKEKQTILDHQHKLLEMKLHLVKHKKGTKKILDPKWRRILADSSPAFQPLRQMLLEQEPDSQDEWLRHVKAVLKSHIHTT